MVDPISIMGVSATVSKTVFNVAQTLYIFINATKNVDESVKTLHVEVLGLSRVIDAITGSLSNPIIQSQKATASPANQELLLSVEGSLSDCKATIKKFDAILGTVAKRSNGRNPFRQPIRQIKLNLNEDDIKNLRAQIHTHSMTLQMALQMINLHVSCLLPDRVIDKISPMIEVLTNMMKDVNISQSIHKLPDDPENRRTARQTERLQRSAHAILSNASSIIGPRSTVWGGSERDSTTGSEYGEPFDVDGRARIERWVTEPNLDETFLGEQESSKGKSRTTETNEIFESDDDFEVDVVNRFLDKGLDEFDKANFSAAEELLQKGVEEADKMRSKKRSLVQVNEGKLKLAVIYYQQNKTSQSEEMLTSLANETIERNPDSAYILEAAHSLALIKVEESNFHVAQTYCNKARIGRQRILGKDHPDHYTSLRLLSVICQKAGNLATAAVYIDLIPAELNDQVDNSVFFRTVLSPRRVKEARLLGTQKLKEAGFDVEAANFATEAALLWAIQEDSGPCIQVLLENGANVDQSYSRGITALMQAIFGYKKIAIKVLLDKGADIEAKTNDGSSALYIASQEGHDTVVQLLLNQGADIEAKTNGGSSALHVASNEGHDTVVRILLDKGADIEAKANDGFSALHIASYGGHDTVVRLLLDKGADIEAKNNDGFSALLIASEEGHDTVVQLLLDTGADIEAKTNNGSSAIHIASQYGQDTVIRTLLDQGADIEAKTNGGLSALYIASQEGHDTVVRLLLNRGVDIEAKSKQGFTALHCASWIGRSSIVRVLLEAGADMKQMNDGLSSPLSVAIREQHREAARALWKKIAEKAELGLPIEFPEIEAFAPFESHDGQSWNAKVEILKKNGYY